MKVNLSVVTIINIPTWLKLTIVFVVFALSFAGGYVLIISPQNEQLSTLIEQENYDRLMFVKQIKQSTTLKNKTTNTKQISAWLNRYNKRHKGYDLLKFVNDIERISSLQKLNIIEFKTTLTGKLGTKTFMPISVAVTGKYHAMLNMLKDIVKLKHFVRINSVMLSPAEDDAKHTTMNMEMTVDFSNYRKITLNVKKKKVKPKSPTKGRKKSEYKPIHTKERS